MVDEHKAPHDYCNWLWKNEELQIGILVGSYPRWNTINGLKEIGVNVIINLCTEHEDKSFKSYKKSFGEDTIYFEYSIAKFSTPKFSKVYEWATSVIRQTFRMKTVYYVHSVSGHGRSHMIGLLLYSLITNTTDWLVLHGYAMFMYLGRRSCLCYRDGPWRPPFDNDRQVEWLKNIRKRKIKEMKREESG